MTGGEPLVRKNIMHLVRQLSRHLASGALDELTLTTNGSQLARFAAELADCGVKRINVSLDTLDPQKFHAITRWGHLEQVIAGIDAAQAAGLNVKINTVALKGFNETEIPELIRWAHGRGMELTLIETMPMGEIDADRTDQYLPLSAVRAGLEQRFTLSDIGCAHRRPRPLCRGRRDRRPARLHHAADAQFLRELQPRAADLHRHALSCASARKMPPICARRCVRPKATSCVAAAIDEAIRASRRATTSSSTAPAAGRRSPAT